MEALLATFLAVALLEQGDRMQRLAVDCVARFGLRGAVAAGLIAAGGVNALIAAIGGMFVQPMLPFRATNLLLALALLSAGGGALLRAGAPGVIAYPRLGALAGPGFAGLVLGFGSAAQFVVFALAARSGSVLFATLGATLGTAAAIAPAVALGARLPPLRGVRTGVAILCLIVGFVIGLAALRLM